MKINELFLVRLFCGVTFAALFGCIAFSACNPRPPRDQASQFPVEGPGYLDEVLCIEGYLYFRRFHAVAPIFEYSSRHGFGVPKPCPDSNKVLTEP